MKKFQFLLGVILCFSITCFAEMSEFEKKKLIMSQLAHGQEDWVELKSNENNKKLGVSVYDFYDNGSIKKSKGIAYVNVLMVEYNRPVKHTAILAFNCKIRKATQLTINEDINSAFYLWNDGKVIFNYPRDGGDYTIWSYPEKNFPEVNELFMKICSYKVHAELKNSK